MFVRQTVAKLSKIRTHLSVLSRSQDRKLAPQTSCNIQMAIIVIWILLSLFNDIFGQEVRAKLFNLHSDSLSRVLVDCIISCVENEYGAVSMEDERCIKYSTTEWHPEMTLDASENVILIRFKCVKLYDN